MSDKPPARPPARPPAGAPATAARGHGVDDGAHEATAQAPEKRMQRPRASPFASPTASPAPTDLDAIGETRVRPATLSEHAELVVIAGSFKGTTVRLSAGTVVIGRASECDLVLRTGSGVSRRHCKVQYLGNRFVVVDLESRNGTIVNGQSVERKVLEPGDRIEVGDEVIEFVVRPAPPLAAPRAPSPSPDVTATYHGTAPSPLPGAAHDSIDEVDAGDIESVDDADDDGDEPLPPTLPPQSADLALDAGLPPPRSARDTGVFSAVPAVPSLPPRASSQKFAGTGSVLSPAPPLPPPPPRRLAPIFFVVVVVASVAVLGFFAWGALDEGAPVIADAGARAVVVDAGAPARAVVDAGSPANAIVDAGSPASAVVDAGAPAAIVDAAAPAPIVDAGMQVAAPVAVRAHGTGRARQVLVAVGDHVDVGDGLIVVELDGGGGAGGRKIAALRREEAEFAAVDDPRSRAELEAVRAEIRRLESRATGTVTMTSDKAGTVVDVLVNVGDVVRDATPIVRLQP